MKDSMFPDMTDDEFADMLYAMQGFGPGAAGQAQKKPVAAKTSPGGAAAQASKAAAESAAKAKEAANAKKQ